MTIQEYERRLKMERDFLGYLRLLKAGLQHYLVIITVADTGAAPYFTPECAQAMLDLGLQVNMLERYRQPYIAIIDYGKVVREKVSEDLEKPLVIKGKLNHHDLAIYSAGFMYMHGIGCGAMVLIDGVNYSTGGRGFNFFVFDRMQERVVDAFGCDTYNGGRCYHAVNPTEPALLAFKDKFRDVTICTLSLPRRQSKYNLDASEFEHWLENNPTEMKRLFTDKCGDKSYMKLVYDEKRFPFCNDYSSFEEFFDAFQGVQSYINLDGTQRHIDYSSPALNTRNGIRITTDNPANPKRSVYFIGPSYFFGWGSPDSRTIESDLQRLLNVNVPDKAMVVYNYSFTGEQVSRDISNLRSLPLKKGDIVIFHSGPIWGIPCCWLTLKSVRPHPYGEIFTDGHYTPSGNRMIADGIFEFLQKHNFFEDNLPADVGAPIPVNRLQLEDEDEELHNYKGRLENFYKHTISPRIGSIVMNCNPFTLGHRYLVEQALKRCDHLIVFVVEEDKSVFPFAERLELVRKNLSDLKNVSVIPSGQFIISSRTFEEYFNKESLQERKVDTSLDVNLFGKEIAPCLNISMRFAGEEPFDNVTRQYNASMARILPQYGVKFIEIPRMKYKGSPVSASEVRRLAEARQFDKLKKLVPPLTLRYLRRKVP